MKFVGEHLLNLDILNLCTLVDLNDLKIHFPSVKEFIAKDVDAGNLNLPNLQDLEIQCTPRTRRGCKVPTKSFKYSPIGFINLNMKTIVYSDIPMLDASKYFLSIAVYG